LRNNAVRGIRDSVITFSIVVSLDFYDTEDILIFAVDELISEVGDYNLILPIRILEKYEAAGY